MKVKAKQLGYYGDRRRREGEVFEVANPKHFSSKWMESLEDAPAKKAGKSESKGKDQKAEEKHGDPDVI